MCMFQVLNFKAGPNDKINPQIHILNASMTSKVMRGAGDLKF